MKIGIIGAGNVGGGLGAIWRDAGHEVQLASRSQGSPAEAAEFGDVVLLAVPEAAVGEALGAAGSLDGKVLIDATNRLEAPGSGSGSLAEEVARTAGGARVVKAFNTVFAAAYDEIPQSGRPDLVFCGDDAEAKSAVATLIRDAGFEPVDAGGLSVAADMEAFARLAIGIAYGQGRGPFFYKLSAPGGAGGG